MADASFQGLSKTSHLRLRDLLGLVALPRSAFLQLGTACQGLWPQQAPPINQQSTRGAGLTSPACALQHRPF